MAVALAHHDVANPGHRCHDPTRIQWQDLVGITVEEKKWSATQSGRHFASSRLRRERDDSHDFVHHDRHADCNRTSKRVTHHDDTFHT